ncbi:MAG: CHAT domain-containing protein [Synechococcales bacterium]|nr:CHAT domain-containing protein [Synechococcales bacterium]
MKRVPEPPILRKFQPIFRRSPWRISGYFCLGLMALLMVVGLPAIATESPQALLDNPLAEAVTLAAETSQPQAGAIALERGKTAYQSGRLQEAAAQWEAAAQFYADRGELVNQALSFNYLSLAYQELGQWDEAAAVITQSLDLMETLRSEASLKPQELQVLAHAFNTKGQLHLIQGHADMALAVWQQAETTYTLADDAEGVLGSRINQVQALQTLGFFRRAQDLLEVVGAELQSQPDSALKALSLRSYGVLLYEIGDLAGAQQALAASVAMTEAYGSQQDLSTAWLDLGNTYAALKDMDTALDAYQRAIALSSSPLGQVEAQLSQLKGLIATAAWDEADALLPGLYRLLNQLPPSRTAVYARVALAESLVDYELQRLKPRQAEDLDVEAIIQIAQLLAAGLQQARDLEDSRAEASVLGQLGHLYERSHQWREAKDLTQQALFLAQSTQMAEEAYRWQWQLGRILAQQADNGAIAAYTDAVQTLRTIRKDLLAVNPELQFSFREKVEPVYRELVELLLQSGEPTQEQLQQARDVIEELQLAELENFFRSACLETKVQQIEEIDRAAAVIYPIILPHQLAVILSVPGSPLRYYSTLQLQADTEAAANEFLAFLNPIFDQQEMLARSQQFYDWLIRPAEAILTENQMKTLVFVPDGILRNLPLAALYDGQRYLVESYNIALTPGLQMLAARTINPKRTPVLLAGLSEARQGFPPLPGVGEEIKQISDRLESAVMMNQDFNADNLQQELDNQLFPIIHLATHGQFSSSFDQTFILTWDDQLSARKFQDILGQRAENEASPLEMLVLSACQTATGDQRAALGLAGLAVRSGARSTVGTLWAVNDESTAELMVNFYQFIQESNTSRAKALRQAQLSLLQSSAYRHPYYWSSFVLVGNWI